MDRFSQHCISQWFNSELMVYVLECSPEPQIDNVRVRCIISKKVHFCYGTFVTLEQYHRIQTINIMVIRTNARFFSFKPQHAQGFVCKFKVNNVPCGQAFSSDWYLKKHKRKENHVNRRRRGGKS